MAPETTSLKVVPGTQALLVEDAVDTLIALLQLRLNPLLVQVYQEYENDGRKIALEAVAKDRYYISETIVPYQVPAVFVLADASDHDLELGQNWEYTIHDIMVGAVVEESDESRLARKRWRYGRALWAALHDQSFYNVHVLVTRLQYDVLFGMDNPSAGTRRFRADVGVRLRVQHFERQEP